MEFPSDSGYRQKEPKAAQGRQTGNNREKHLQQDRTRVNNEMDLAEKPILARYSLLDVCIRCAMLYLAVLRANENKLSGGSTEAQCGSQQQRDDQTVLL